MRKTDLNIFQKIITLLICFSLLLTPSDLTHLIVYSMEAAESDIIEETSEAAEESTPESDESGIDDIRVGETGILQEADTPNTEGVVRKTDDSMYAGEIGCDGLHIAVSFTEEADIPEGTVISLQEIITDTQEYANYFEQADAVLNQSITEESETGITLQYARFFDISFLHEGEEVEPAAAVTVEITYDRPELDYENCEILSDVIHFTEEEPVLMEADLEQDVPSAESADIQEQKAVVSDLMKFETDSFSTYGIVFYENISNSGDEPAAATAALRSAAYGEINLLAAPAGNTIYTATKVSVSDTENLTDGKSVVVYSKMWDNDAKKYVNYAIDGNGDLVKVWESGGVIQWKDTDNTSLYWEFIQYGDSGYYEFYNPVTGMYLAPQSDQLLSNSTIGVTLTGRENGDYTSTIEAWDGNIWSWYGYAYAGTTDAPNLIPSIDTASAQMCFAVERQVADFTPVETVDSKADGLTIKMFDYDDNDIKKNDGIAFQTDIMGSGEPSIWTGSGGVAYTGLVLDKLDENGFPVSAVTGRSLSALFSTNSHYAEQEVNHLFIKSTYDETGYYEYSCFDNSAFLMNEANMGYTGSEYSKEGYDGVYDFTVYQELVTPSIDNYFYYRRGNFLPYDHVDSDDKPTLNQFNSDGNALTTDDPRYNETLYVQQNVDYYYGMSITANFMIPKDGVDKNGEPLIFEFTGDDDFWLFIDDVLVLDIGGIHDALSGSVNFKTGDIVTYNGVNAANNGNPYTKEKLLDKFRAAGVFPDGTDWDETKIADYFTEEGGPEATQGVFKDYSSHTMKIFYMERGAGASNLKLRFNLAIVPENSVFLEKQLTGMQTNDYSNTKYAYQLYYREKGSEDAFTLYANPVGGEAHLENSNEKIGYAPTATIAGVTYQNVFYLRAGQKAEFVMPDQGKEWEYYFVELGLLNDEYDYVKVNGDPIEGTNERTALDPETHEEKQYSDFQSSTDTITNRKRVIYENHVNPDFLRSLVITKKLVRLDDEGNEIPVNDDNTGFEFQVYFLNENGEPAPYQKGDYYVVDDDGYYYIYLNGQLVKAGRDKVVCSVSGNNGSIAGIPNGYSVVIEDLLPTTRFEVEEQSTKIPLGYQWLRYERVIETLNNAEEATYTFIDDNKPNKGIIRENIDAHMNVVNKKGFGIKVDKIWADARYTVSHGDIYIALFDKNSGTYIENTLRKLVSPDTSVSYYFDKQEEAESCAAREVDPTSIQPSNWSDTSAVTNCSPYANDIAAVNADGTEYNYAITYETGETFGGTGSNIRTDKITNDRDHLKIRKKSTDGTALRGAVFTLKDNADSGKTLTFTSDSEGFVSDSYFTPGHSYTLEETSAPNGYQGLTNPVTITVNNEGTLTINRNGNSASLVDFQLDSDNKSGTLTIKNTPKGIILKKTDTEGEPLKGAVFTVYRANREQYRQWVNWQWQYYYYDYWTKSTAVAQNVTSDVNGIFYGGTLSNGYYLIEEITPPNGYKKLENSMIIYVSGNEVTGQYTVTYNSSYNRYDLYAPPDQTSATTTISIPNEKAYADLIIEKTIDGLDASKGYPTFMFKVTQTKDENGNSITSGTEYIRYISYDTTDTEPLKNAILEDLPIGTYKVEELSALNYTAVGLTVSGDDHAIINSDHMTAIVTLSSAGAVTVTYENHLGKRELYHTAFADNKISYSSSAELQE